MARAYKNLTTQAPVSNEYLISVVIGCLFLLITIFAAIAIDWLFAAVAAGTAAIFLADFVRSRAALRAIEGEA